MLLILAAVGIATTVALSRPPPPVRMITVTNSYPEPTVDLLATADAVAIIAGTDQRQEHWNSAENTEWESDSNARMALIYRDEEVQVIRVLKGDLAGRETIRGVGGRVGDVEVVMHGSHPFEVGKEYLVFLSYADTPTQEGSERALTVHFMGLGSFERVDGTVWRNPTSGFEILEVDVLAKLGGS